MTPALPPVLQRGLTVSVRVTREMAWQDGQRTVSVRTARLGLTWRGRTSGNAMALIWPLLVSEQGASGARHHVVPDLGGLLVLAAGVVAIVLLTGRLIASGPCPEREGASG